MVYSPMTPETNVWLFRGKINVPLSIPRYSVYLTVGVGRRLAYTGFIGVFSPRKQTLGARKTSSSEHTVNV